MHALDDAGSDKETDRWTFVVAIAIAAAVTLPLLGAVGFFDPWETNYAEVARQMVIRDDYLYPFWKETGFFSKPALLFWVTAPLYKLVGATDSSGPMTGMVELVGRLPSALSSIFAVAVVYFAARRLWNRRAALFSSIVLATLPFWAFMSRQAITDMLYVAPASAGMLLLAVALFDDERPTETAPLPKWLIFAIAACALPQLWEVGRTGAFLERFGMLARLSASLVSCAVVTAFLVWLTRRAKDPLLHLAALLFALSTLAKGPVGVGVCGLSLVVALAVMNEWQRVLRPAVWTSTAVFLLVAAPWPIVMTLYAGVDEQRKTWFQRFVLYDLLGRVGGGAHGDRGTFEYYVRYAAFGLFPWGGLLVPALFDAAKTRRDGDTRTPANRFTIVVAAWALVTFAFFTLTTTKFHHYIFPLCVPAALLVGRYLDRLLEKPNGAPILVALFVITATVLVGRDLVLEPWQLIDLFTYHYKGYKPEYYFPPDDEWRLGLSIACFGAAGILLAGAAADLVRPLSERRAWFSRLVLGSGARADGFVTAALVAGFLFSIFAVQVHFNRASQHWSQRWIFNTYHSMKKESEPIIAYQMDWKGETFYGKNQEIQVNKAGVDLRKQIEKPGREFVIVHTDRFGGMKTSLGKAYESKIKVVDRSNQKWYLVTVDDRAVDEAVSPAP